MFLRMLEYYQGVMILTTNRVRVIDAAFLSRVHLAVQYNGHSQETRQKMWENFVDDIPSDDVSGDVNSATFKELSTLPLNGRQIKNCMRTAVALARGHARQLCFADLQETAKGTLDFCSQLQTATNECGPEIEEHQQSEDNQNLGENQQPEATTTQRPAKRRRLDDGDGS